MHAGCKRAALVVALLLALPASAARIVDRIAAVVGDDIILDSEVDQAALPLARGAVDLESPEGRKQWQETRRKALDSLIDSKLVQQQAVELKLSVTSDEIDRALDEVKKQNKLDDATFAE